ncbi:MAG: Lrp/AsnC family transcriptional regulator [Pseudomonadota bacterium]|nr:Lrp/AsnC family transcriptional regulator [Pseudomonadota bacterium]
MPKLDNIDYNILRNIQADGRISNLNLADKIGLSPSPCLRRVRDLEKRKVIKRYVGLIDPKAVGFLINAFVNVRLRSQEKKFLNIFEHKVSMYNEVIECYLMTGSSDYLLRVVTRDLEEYERFVVDKLTKIEGIANIQTSFALKPLIQRTEIPI